jgi:hypothetical protein
MICLDVQIRPLARPRITMRKSLLATWVAFALCAVADEPVDLDRIAALNRALQDGGVTGLLAVVSEHRWDAPWMPSKWHVENRLKDAERVKVANAGRSFGSGLPSIWNRSLSSSRHCRPARNSARYPTGCATFQTGAPLRTDGRTSFLP